MVNGPVRNAGYAWIFDPPYGGRATVNVAMLSAQWVAVLLVGGIVWWLLGGQSSRQKGSVSPSLGRTQAINLAGDPDRIVGAPSKMQLVAAWEWMHSSGMRRAARVAVELTLLSAFAWFVERLIKPWSFAVELSDFSLRWFVFTFLVATMTALTPFLALFLPAAIVARVFSKNPNYWKGYRLAFIAAVMCVPVFNYFAWYGVCRTAHSLEYCESFGTVGN
jgi:hypothetical protein